MQHPTTKQASGTDYVTSLLSTITTELPNPEYHNQKFHMLSKITDISLEYEIAAQPDLARSFRSEYLHVALLYDRILRHRKIIVNKSDTVWNWFYLRKSDHTHET